MWALYSERQAKEYNVKRREIARNVRLSPSSGPMRLKSLTCIMRAPSVRYTYCFRDWMATNSVASAFNVFRTCYKEFEDVTHPLGTVSSKTFRAERSTSFSIMTGRARST